MINSENNELYTEAIRTIQKVGIASNAVLQRRLALSYDLSSRIMEQLEADGIVSPLQGKKHRKIYIPHSKVHRITTLAIYKIQELYFNRSATLR